jgi:hypothetical protein
MQESINAAGSTGFPMTAMSRDHGDLGDPRDPSLALGTYLCFYSPTTFILPQSYSILWPQSRHTT